MTIWADQNTDNASAKQIAISVVNLLAREGITIGEARGVMEIALGIITEPVDRAVIEARKNAASNPIQSIE